MKDAKLPPMRRADMRYVAKVVYDNRDEIVGWIADDCLSMKAIAYRLAERCDRAIDPYKIRMALLADRVSAAALVQANVDRAHTMVEQANEWADNAAAAGDFVAAAGVKLKIAAKLAPQHYSERLEVTGAGGDPLLQTTQGVTDAELESIVAARNAQVANERPESETLQ